MAFLDTVQLVRTAVGNIEKLISSVAVPTRIAVYPIYDNTGAIDDQEDVYADTIFSYDYDERVRITENPVEQGIKTNDHRIIEAKRLSIECGVSNIVGIKDALLNIGRSSTETLLQTAKLMVFGNRYDSRSRVAATYSRLQIAMYNGEPFDVETPLGLYKNMLITGIKSMQDSDTISMFRGVVSFQELITFTNASSISGKITAKEVLSGGLKNPIVQSIVPTGLSF